MGGQERYIGESRIKSADSIDQSDASHTETMENITSLQVGLDHQWQVSTYLYQICSLNCQHFEIIYKVYKLATETFTGYLKILSRSLGLNIILGEKFKPI